MKITVEFNSMEEFLQHVSVDGSIETEVMHFIPGAQKVEEVPAEVEEAPTAPAEAAPVAVPWEEPQDTVEAKTPAVTEDFRIEVRKTLAALNKVQTGNPAKALIAEIGYKRLTDVPLEALPGLMEKAKEAMNNA